MKTKTCWTMLTDGVKTGMRRSIYTSLALTLILLAAGPAIRADDLRCLIQREHFPDRLRSRPGAGRSRHRQFHYYTRPGSVRGERYRRHLVDQLEYVLGSALSFTYNPAADGPFSPGTLRVGGLNNGADAVQFNPSTDDFWLHIDDFASLPAFEQLGYSQTSVSSNNLFYTLNQTGSVSAVAVPEPASFSMLGVLGLGLALASLSPTPDSEICQLRREDEGVGEGLKGVGASCLARDLCIRPAPIGQCCVFSAMRTGMPGCRSNWVWRRNLAFVCRPRIGQPGLHQHGQAFHQWCRQRASVNAAHCAVADRGRRFPVDLPVRR